MGARPIALLNSLRFGPMDGPDGARTRRIVEGVVAGIAGYGNSIGIPTIGGEIAFEPTYAGNPLVNVLCLGIARSDALVKGTAGGVGNPVYYVGASTGRDGIHGATMASAEFDEKSSEKRPAVQVGDPFMEKLLLEACLELMKTDALVGVQDMGAAGLTCSTCEMGARGGMGVEIDVSLVPQRETGMTPYEIMLSESQERMLLVVKRGREAEVEAIFEKWDLHAANIGDRDRRRSDAREGSRSGCRRDSQHGVGRRGTHLRSSDDAARLSGGRAEPGSRESSASTDGSQGAARAVVIADHRQQAMGVPPIRPHGPHEHARSGRHGRRRRSSEGDCPARSRSRSTETAATVISSPRRGAMLAVAEAARNVACAGGVPIGATNCLNFGNPQRPEIMWQLVESIEGIAEACRALDVPITGGNVSLYNETDGKAIYPTPTIGVVGLIEDAAHALGRAFKRSGDTILLLGESFGELGGSEYLKTVHDLVRGLPPALDLQRERALIACLTTAAAQGVLESAHDCSDGGLAVALAECAFDTEGIGLEVDVPRASGADERDALTVPATLFGESASRVVVSVVPAHVATLMRLAAEHGVPAIAIGTTGGSRIKIAIAGKPALDCSVEEAESAWSTSVGTHFARHDGGRAA